MDCSVFQSIVAGDREDDLSAAESEAFEAHLESCAVCREAVLRAEEDLERMAHLADPPVVSAAAWSRVDAAVHEEAQRRPGREDPFGAVAVAPAMPVTLARPEPVRRRAALAVVAMVAASFVAFAFFGASDPGTMIVKPPGEGDVTVSEFKVGEGFKQRKNDRTEAAKKKGILVGIVEGQ